MSYKTAVIVIDTGFSLESLQSAANIIAVSDLSTGFKAIGNPLLTFEDSKSQLDRFAGDPLNHGSLVLRVLTQIEPNLPVILVRAYSDQVKLIRTRFGSGEIIGDGWTEAYKWAVEICKERGYNSVTNCSFGGYTHAMDGTGWEAHCLGEHTGKGIAGHIVLAGAGAGDGRNIHASWSTESSQTTQVFARQETSTTYNFWNGISPDANCVDWTLEVFLNGAKVQQHDSEMIPLNFWNNARQLTFTVLGVGEVELKLSRRGDSEESSSRFDCWINHQDSASFLSHADAYLVSEPASFPFVIAVGLENGLYASDQTELDSKPDLLISGGGPISFRLPEVVHQVVTMLEDDPSLDVVQVRDKLLSA